MSRDDTMNFGGPPTIEKLDIGKEYLNAYTTALKYKPRKDNPFKLMYIDAFAGTGEYQPARQEDPRRRTSGHRRFRKASDQDQG